MTTTPVTTSPETLKKLVQEKYGQIALQDRATNASSCCGATCGCDTPVVDIMAEDYTKLDGYAAEADLGLGCGIPTEFVQLTEGQTVLDLGSGAGNDAFIARRAVGQSGKVIGVDFTPAMIAKARANADTLGYQNVEFREGDIEDLPLSANRVDVILSNCVLNLVPNKAQAFKEMYRVLKPGGYFSVSDIVLAAPLPERLLHVAELYAGCVSGASPERDYLAGIAQAGFTDVTVVKRRNIEVPHEVLAQYLTTEEMAAYKAQPETIVSITVKGTKPASAACCNTGSGCC